MTEVYGQLANLDVTLITDDKEQSKPGSNSKNTKIAKSLRMPWLCNINEREV